MQLASLKETFVNVLHLRIGDIFFFLKIRVIYKSSLLFNKILRCYYHCGILLYRKLFRAKLHSTKVKSNLSVRSRVRYRAENAEENYEDIFVWVNQTPTLSGVHFPASENMKFPSKDSL